MSIRIEITEPEHFAFQFIGKHDGKGIPLPLPTTIKSLVKKGLVMIGRRVMNNTQRSCCLTPLGKTCYKPK